MLAAGIEPLEPYRGSTARWRCRCVICGSEITPSLSSVRGGSGCIACGHVRTGMKRRMSEADAIAIMQAAHLEPLDAYPGAQVRWRCRCVKCGGIVEPRLHSIQGGQGGCRSCGNRESGSRRRASESSARAAAQALGLEPLEPYPGLTHLPWRYRCLSCGREARGTANAMKSGHGCLPCGLRKSAMTRRLDAEEAAAVAASVDLVPLELYPGRDRPWPCECARCGRIVTVRLGNMRAGNGCAYCSQVRVDPDDAVKIMLAAGLTPLVPSPGSKEQWLSRCDRCGREVRPTFNMIGRGQGGCRACGLLDGAAKNRRDADEAEAIMREYGVTPLVSYPGRNKAWRCTCNRCEREITPRLGGVLMGQGPCRYCADRGAFDSSKPTLVYLLVHDGFAALKVGVANVGSLRLGGHERHGWRTVKTWECRTGGDALFVERTTLRWWRDDCGAAEACTLSDMPQGGWTETAPMMHVGLDRTAMVIDALMASL
jgi:hypothetical protein